MTAANSQWDKLKHAYLKQVEHSMASTGHPKSADVLRDVEGHLDRKFDELAPVERSWEGYQQIITEMGPPEDYAELLSESTAPSDNHSMNRVNTLLAVVFVIVLIIVGGYLVYTAETTTAGSGSAAPASSFEPDARVLGTWSTVDFVRQINGYDPAKQYWQGDLFLQGLVFEEDGDLLWTNRNGGPYLHRWTRGKVDPLANRPAFYYLRSLGGDTYLFFEWISGDVTVREQEPAYYVLKKADSP